MSPGKLQDKDKKAPESTNSRRNAKSGSRRKRAVDSNAQEAVDSDKLDYGLFDERRSEDVVYAPRSQDYWRRLAQRLQTLVDSGDVGALWRLARLYEDGRGVERDWKRMLELLEQGAAKDEPNATARLGLCYEYAIGVKYDPKRAWEYYDKASTLADDFELVGLVKGKTLEKEAEEKVRFIFFMVDRRKKAQRRMQTLFVTNEPQDGDAFLKTTELIQNSCSAYSLKRLAFLFSKLGRPDELAQQIACDFLGRVVDIWRAEAALGNLAAAYALGELVDSGLVEEESGEFDKFLPDVLLNEYAPGMTRYALKLEEQGFTKDALNVYRKAGEFDWPDALCKAGLMELNGLGDVETSFLRLRRGAELNHAPSIYFLGDYYWNVEERQDRRRAVNLFLRAAEMGLGIAQERYAAYLNSEERMILDGAPPNPEEAFLMYRRAADNGRELARVAVACMIYEGVGVEQNCEQANELFRQILEYGETKTREALAIRFLETDGYEDKVELALQTLEETARELSSSYVVLGFCYFVGRHVRRDCRRAAKYFGLAAAGGESVGAINFARCCQYGTGVKRNPVVAAYFLRLAATLGDSVAAFQLGETYAKGEDVPQNWRYAFEWYNIAVQRENYDAFSKLAECYWNGLGVERDYDKAIQLWTSATAFDDGQVAEDLERAKQARVVQKIFERSEVEKPRVTKRAGRKNKALNEADR